MILSKKKKEIELDWFKLSFTEYASGIEVFHAALFFKNDKNSQKRILDHALDEYRHSQYFYNLHKEEGKIEKISSPHALVNYGGLSKSPFPCSKEKLTSICSYLYIGEIRAIEFGKKVKENCKDDNILSIFEIIDKDENKSVLFMSINKAKFRKPVLPNHKIRFHVRLINNVRNVYKFLGKAYHFEQLVAESEFSAMITKSNI